jgi:hypothetical protein
MLRIAYHSRFMATVAFAIAVLSACSSSKPRPSEIETASAEDEVYEAVVRHMISPAGARPRINQLVFGDGLLTELEPGGSVESCKTRTSKEFSLVIRPPQYNSIADKAYRFFVRGEHGGALRSDTVQNFLARSCRSGGPLSHTFHTDLPRTFIPAESVHFKGWPIQKDESKAFEQLYPGAGGIISFSHVGFDSTLDEAIVSTSFVCGGLCGTGYRYILRKKSGRWEVVDGLMVWVS